jgi:acyl-CoA thioester hydrolase
VEDGHFRRTLQIGTEHVDELGHVNNLVWVRLVLDLATAHSNSVGLDARAYRKIGAWWIVHRQEIDYHAPAFPGEKIVEETWISSMRGARSVRESRFTRVTDGALLLSARTTWAYVDAKSHRPRRIDQRVLEALPVV